MSTPSDGRLRRRLATRTTISAAATRLFKKRGFERVTVDEIATAAGVGRMTVFNHFPRKEDLFFDRDEESREVVRAALRQRDPAVPPTEALRRLAHRLVAERSPFVEFSAASRAYVDAIERSESLKARARAIRDELTLVVAEALHEPNSENAADPTVRLTAALLTATWTVALTEGYAVFARSRTSGAARNAFLTVIDRGSAAVDAALFGTRDAAMKA